MSASAMDSGAVLDLTELGRRLTQAREALPLTMEEAAQRLHLPSATVADLEAAWKRPLDLDQTLLAGVGGGK